MRNEEIRAVEMTRKIRDEMYQETKDFSDAQLISYFKEKARRDPGEKHACEAPAAAASKIGRR
jgi:hypothetical protein